MRDPKQIESIESAFGLAHATYCTTLLLLTLDLESRVVDKTAKEYLLHGAGRRLRILYSCISSVFAIFPPGRTQPLSEEDRIRICIHLHAFYINLLGVLDNLAWVIVHHRGLSEEFTSPGNVGLYHNKVKPHLNQQLCEYIYGEPIKSWRDRHSKEYRDSLAHRIPLYVPQGFTEDGSEVAYPVFTGSVQCSNTIDLHAQLLADFNTVAEVIHKFAQFEFSSS